MCGSTYLSHSSLQYSAPFLFPKQGAIYKHIKSCKTLQLCHAARSHNSSVQSTRPCALIIWLLFVIADQCTACNVEKAPVLALRPSRTEFQVYTGRRPLTASLDQRSGSNLQFRMKGCLRASSLAGSIPLGKQLVRIVITYSKHVVRMSARLSVTNSMLLHFCQQSHTSIVLQIEDE